MFPFYTQPSNNPIKDMIESLKALEEWQKSQKPKEEKKAEPWGFTDVFIWCLVFNTTLAWALVLFIETYIKH